jgi:DNA segregation ATPase FtsK/SpoIIIE, S-DNA-T family
MDSRIILDEGGAERLLAQGDMLFLAPGVGMPLRHHGPWVTDKEIHAVMKFWSDQGEPQFDSSALRALEGPGTSESGLGSGDDMNGGAGGEQEYDEMYDQVLAYVTAQKEVSASLLQRRFKLGYPRASRLVEQFEREGIVGPSNGSKPRTVLIGSIPAADAELR